MLLFQQTEAITAIEAGVAEMPSGAQQQQQQQRPQQHQQHQQMQHLSDPAGSTTVGV